MKPGATAIWDSMEFVRTTKVSWLHCLTSKLEFGTSTSQTTTLFWRFLFAERISERGVAFPQPDAEWKYRFAASTPSMTGIVLRVKESTMTELRSCDSWESSMNRK